MGNILNIDGWDAKALNLKLNIADIDNVPVENETDAPISSGWAFIREYLSNSTQSAGIIDGGIISDGGSGTIDITNVKGILKTTDNEIGINYFFELTGLTGQTLTDNSTNYIAIDYNSGTPQWVVGVSNTANGHTIFNVGKVYREGIFTSIINTGLCIYDTFKRIQLHHTEEALLHFASGGIIGETGTLNISATFGIIYSGLNRMITYFIDTSKSDDITGSGSGGTVSANNTIILDSGEGNATTDYVEHAKIKIENSSNSNDGNYHVSSSSFDATNTTIVIKETTLTTGADTGNIRPFSFEYYYYNGSNWIETLETDIDVTNYNDTASGLAELTPNRYGVHWVYKGINGDNYIVYGQGDYTLSNAQSSQPPSSLPNHIIEFGVLRAKIIIKKADGSFTEIESVMDVSFTSSTPSNHNELSNLDAGEAGYYGHHTADEELALVGTNGTPSTTNKFVTDSDSRNTDARTPISHNNAYHSETYSAIVSAPANYNSTGTVGNIAYDDDYFYVCVSSDRWLRILGTKNF